MSQFNKYLRNLRKSYKQSRPSFAKKLDISESVLANIESGRRKVTSDIVKKYLECCMTDQKKDLLQEYLEYLIPGSKQIACLGLQEDEEKALRLYREFVSIVSHRSRVTSK